jgi:hypothetical protein
MGQVWHLHNGCDELNHERWYFQKRRPERVNEVDQQPLDVGTIMILQTLEGKNSLALRSFMYPWQLQYMGFMYQSVLIVWIRLARTAAAYLSDQLFIKFQFTLASAISHSISKNYPEVSIYSSGLVSDQSSTISRCRIVKCT